MYSQEVAKKCAGRPHTPLLSLPSCQSCKFLTWHQIGRLTLVRSTRVYLDIVVYSQDLRAQVCVLVVLLGFIPCVVPWSHHHGLFRIVLSSHDLPPAVTHHPPPLTLTTPDLFFSIFPTLLCRECYIRGTVQHGTFWDWLFLLSTVPWKSLQVVGWINSLFLFIATWWTF